MLTIYTALVAKLFHVYVKELAPWYDLCDDARVFEREVVERALDSALLFAATIAFAAIYMHRKESFPRAVADKYHNQCVKLLVALSPSDQDTQDGTALASTCLLRSYEILSEDEDPGRHLFGASTLAPAIPDFEDRSLRAAGFWNFLREDISYALMHECPLKVRVGRASGQPTDDDDAVNIATLLLGRAINVAFGGHQDDVLPELDHWQQNFSSQPFSRINDRPFPTIRMTRDGHVAATQYHLVARCLLGSGDRASLVVDICGLVMNSESVPVVVNSYGIICYTAQFLRSTEEQQTLVDFLRSTERKTGWPVASLVNRLRQRWDNTSRSES